MGLGWDGMVGYLLGPTLRAPYGANKETKQKLNTDIYKTENKPRRKSGLPCVISLLPPILFQS